MPHETNNLLDALRLSGIIPVVKIEEAQHAVPLARALQAGGLLAAEITFRTAAAEEAIRHISEQVPELLLGAGTVLSGNQVEQAVEAGATFIVSPGLNEEVVAACQQLGVPVIPGVATATEIQKALTLGLTTLKFFPAEASGGLATLKALAAPFGQIQFIPTGGLNIHNMLDYLKARFVLAVGGSWMVKSALIAQGDFNTIRQLAAKAVNKMLGFRLEQLVVGQKQIPQTAFELLHTRFLTEENNPILTNGENDQMVIVTHFLDRAEFYLKKWGMKLLREKNTLQLKELPIDILIKEA